MKCFFYYSNSCFPYSSLAAAMHLGIISPNPPFNITELKKILAWGHRKIKGKPVFAGTDSFGNWVYVLWDAGEPDMVKRIIYSFLEVYRLPQQRVVFLNLNLKDDFLSLVATAFMRYQSTGFWGESLVRNILHRHYPTISAVVNRSYPQNLTKTTNYQIMLP